MSKLEAVPRARNRTSQCDGASFRGDREKTSGRIANESGLKGAEPTKEKVFPSTGKGVSLVSAIFEKLFCQVVVDLGVIAQHLVIGVLEKLRVVIV